MATMSKTAWTIAGAATLGLLWLATGMVRAGNPVWALGLLALGGAAVWVYTASRSLAWRYLFPGVIAMIVFIAFPLLYTVQIGFTNYSSNNLLPQERARAYLLDQAEVVEDQTAAFTLHADTGGTRLVLRPPEGADGPAWASPPLALDSANDAPVAMTALPPDLALGPALSMREVIAHRNALMALRLALPDGRVLAYAGLRASSASSGRCGRPRATARCARRPPAPCSARTPTPATSNRPTARGCNQASPWASAGPTTSACSATRTCAALSVRSSSGPSSSPG